MQLLANKLIICEFFPWWPLNPYQSLLIEHLQAKNVTVKGGRQLKMLTAAIKRGETRPDIIHLHGIPYFSVRPREFGRNAMFYLRLWKIRRAGAKVVWTIHDIYPHDSKWRAVGMRVGRLLARWVDHCFVHGPAALKMVCESWQMAELPRVTTIWHGHFVDVYPNQITRDAARQKLGIDESRFVYLFLGLIRSYKGVDVLLRAFAEMKERADATLLVVGQMVDLDIWREIEVAAKEDSRIKSFPGYVENNDIQVYMNAADVVVFPYRESALTSGAVIMAMGFKKPCIATKLGAIEDVLDTDGAYLLEAATDGAVRVALETAYLERARLPMMGAHNYAKCMQWSWDVVAEETLKIYQRC
jgi:glycosyltransferase involved in cell wall biosynthesis